MADFVFNISLGKVAEKIADGAANLEVVLLKVAESNATLQDYAEMSTLLGAAGNTEANFTNYARKTSITATQTVDNTNNKNDCDIPDQTFTAAGGTLDNDLVKAILCYNQGAGDSNLIPLTGHDMSYTTEGLDMILKITDFYTAS